jgi:hypothetical protein
MPFFNDPAMGWNATPADPYTRAQLPGALAGTTGSIGGGPLAGGPLADGWQQRALQFLDPQVALPIAAQLLGGRTFRESLAGAAQTAGQAIPDMRKRAAANAWLKSQSGLNLTPEEQQMLQANPELVQNIATARFAPRPLIAVAPGARLANPLTGQFVDGGSASGRGDGSNYDLEQANKVYESQFGPAADRAPGAPDFAAWYKSAWPTYAQGQGQGGATSPASAAGGQVVPTSPASAAALPARPLGSGDARRYATTAAILVKPYAEMPITKLLANAHPFLGRIDVAARTKGSAADQELLDSAVKLATGGGQITEGQVNTILQGSSVMDRLNIYQKQLEQGGILSDDQKQQIKTLAHQVYEEYKRQYQPVNDAAVAQLKRAHIPLEFSGLPDLNAISDASDRSSALDEGRAAIAAGVPRAEVEQRLRDNKIDPGGL